MAAPLIALRMHRPYEPHRIAHDDYHSGHRLRADEDRLVWAVPPATSGHSP